MSWVYELYYISLFATVFTSIGMAGLIWFRGEKKAGAVPLTLFSIAVAFWVAGQILVTTGDALEREAGRALVNLSPLAGAFFVHFALSFTGWGRREFIYANYAAPSGAAVFGALYPAGELMSWLSFPRFYWFDESAIWVGGITLAYGLFGLFWLIRAGLKSEERRRRQIKAAVLSAVWGSISASGFVFGSVGIELFPYPVLFLPVYPVLLVYGVLRYEFMDVNLWARKSLAWLIVFTLSILAVSLVVAALASLGLKGFITLPLWQIWAFTLAIAFLTLAIEGGALSAATRLIYPGSRINARLLKEWRDELEGADAWRDLSTRATNIICGHLGFTVEVKASPETPELHSNKPGIIAECGRGAWSFKLSGFEDATPGIVRTAEAFGELVARSAKRLEDALKIAHSEKETLNAKHLADLGRISATVADELRAPLNNIGTASAGCDPEIKKEIARQINRAQRVIGDLLTYSGEFRIEKRALVLKDEVDYVASQYAKAHNAKITVDIAPEIIVPGDTHRVHQVFYSLLDNAQAALRDREDGAILVHAARGANEVRVKVYDNGPGVPEKIKDDIFRPFVSGRGGDGIGLAIVKRIMEAHGGRVDLIKKNNWSCCFELFFPIEG